ncbi:MAG: UvrD-helicase domain-containing protein, partial [Candidatus Binataceae bacterium]
MTTFELSREQLRAMSEPGNLRIRASAGSGKTEVLARRFAAYIAGDIKGVPPLEPAAIAAITFTEKATEDMRRRIAGVLDGYIASASDNDLIQRLRRARRLLPLARISTIHGFCSRILRENPIQAGIDPDFEVLDENESRAFTERAVKQLLIDAVRRGDRAARHLVSARGIHGASTYRPGAVEIVIALITELERGGYDTDWLIERTRTTAKHSLASGGTVRRLARQLIGRIEELIAAGHKLPELSGLESEWPRYLGALASLNAESETRVLEDLR